MNQTTVLIAYRRSWKRTLLGSLLVCTLILLFAAWLWPTSKSVGWVFFLGFNFVMYLWHAVNASYYKRDVIVTLDSTTLICSIPGNLHSKSYSVAIDEITEINKIDSDSGPEAFRIHTQSATFNLYGNYGIPTRRIVNEIARIRPSIVIGTA